ncbi:MOSC-domain-containing protein [Ramicandelaber brevisporus]|nr:MOSC-domain-containing protein [Ramicandelaber brevisporus]
MGTTQSKLSVSELFIYPIKSCAGISLERGLVEKTGFQFDRNWLIVRARDNKSVTQHIQPVLALIKPEIVLNPSQLGSTPGDIPELRVPLFYDFSSIASDDSRLISVKVLKSTVVGVEVSAEANAWLTKVINHPNAFRPTGYGDVSSFAEYKLIIKYPEIVRPLVKNNPPIGLADYESQTAFANGFPFMLMSEASLENVNNKLAEAVGYNNFRPNIIVAGSKAFEEDDWRLITLGLAAHKLFVNCRCSRCELPNTDQSTGKREGHEPQRTLNGYRRIDPGEKYKACVGVNAMSLDVGGSISVGDEVQVIETGLPPIEKPVIVD